EFYAKMTVIHLKKKDVVKSSVKGISIEFDHERLAAILDVPGRTGICEYIKEARRVRSSRDETFSKVHSFSGGRGEGDDEGNKDDFDREAIIDEATVEGESESDDQFYDAQVGEEEPSDETPSKTQQSKLHLRLSRKIKNSVGVDPSGLTGRDAEFLKFQAEFERKRANQFHDELEKAKAENAKLLALLHKTQTKPHP
ncbi:hypothetical protein Dimus_010308, partial [Dionaea muscipula]